MGIFGAIVRTAVNVATTPLAVVKDVVTLGGELTDEESATKQHIEKLKREADEDFDDED